MLFTQEQIAAAGELPPLERADFLRAVVDEEKLWLERHGWKYSQPVRDDARKILRATYKIVDQIENRMQAAVARDRENFIRLN